MGTFLLAFGLIGLSLAGLGIGVMFGRPPLKGSCGGLACAKGLSCSGCHKGAGQ